MDTPHNGDPRNQDACTSSEQDCLCTVGTAEHCLCGLTGSLFAVAIIAVLYPTLVALTEPLYVLSSTALVVITTMLWLLIWFGLECAWEWRAGRLTA